MFIILYLKKEDEALKTKILNFVWNEFKINMKHKCLVFKIQNVSYV
jgi:hypothetical protein